jgi:hypothetical protein
MLAEHWQPMLAEHWQPMLAEHWQPMLAEHWQLKAHRLKVLWELMLVQLMLLGLWNYHPDYEGC